MLMTVSREVQLTPVLYNGPWHVPHGCCQDEDEALQHRQGNRTELLRLRFNRQLTCYAVCIPVEARTSADECNWVNADQETLQVA